MKKMKYPFVPKSTAHLCPGQFWPIQLPSGRCACGRVLHLLSTNGKKETRLFLAGVMDWSGNQPPTPIDIQDARVVETRAAHIKTILESNGAITGYAAYDDGQPETVDFTDDILTGGYNVLNLLAKMHFEDRSEQSPPAYPEGRADAPSGSAEA